jgi:hypothetical protein
MTGSSAIVDSTRVARVAVASCVTQRALLVDEHFVVAGARLSDVAIDRIERPATAPREISSRSVKVNANVDRWRAVGRIPPTQAA